MSNIYVREVTNTEQCTEARALARMVYAREGYTAENTTSQKDIHSYIGMNGVHTFAAFFEDTLLGTVSLVRGSMCALPMESLYKDEVEMLRTTHIDIGEACQFAIDDATVMHTLSKVPGAFMPLDVSTELFGTLLRSAKLNNITALCFVVNPRHASFYAALGCVSVGEVRAYPSVNNAPACAYVLPLIQKTPMSEHFIAKKIWSIAEASV